MYEGSDEDADVEGLGILPGWVHRFPSTATDGEPLTVPHMGWNALRPPVPADASIDPLMQPITGQRVYFVHSFYAAPSDPTHVIAESTYGGRRFPAVAREGSIIGTQFHPEKSADVGRRLLQGLHDEINTSHR